MPPISDELLQKVIETIPSLLWFALALVVMLAFYKPIRDDLMPNLTSFSAGGVELSFVKQSINAALELAEKTPNWKVEVPQEAKDQALNRARKHLHVFRGAQVVWVDDHPENNVNERRMLRQLRVEIDTATGTEEALRLLDKASYEVILSDIARGDDTTAGLAMAQQLAEGGGQTPVIFYVGVVDLALGAPPHAFGITNRPDELLHLILDALERTKYA